MCECLRDLPLLLQYRSQIRMCRSEAGHEADRRYIAMNRFFYESFVFDCIPQVVVSVRMIWLEP